MKNALKHFGLRHHPKTTNVRLGFSCIGLYITNKSLVYDHNSRIWFYDNGVFLEGRNQIR